MRILLFCLLFFSPCYIYSQNNLAPKQIDSIWSHSFRGKGKIFRVTKATPSETYSFNKKNKNLVYILLTYPWERRIEFYILNNQLVKVRIETFRRETKKNYRDVFYFDRETLVFKKQESSDSQDLAELQRLFINYRNKSDSIKGKLFSKKS